MVTSVTQERLYEYRGLSTDQKPMTGLVSGSIFFEIDTSKVFMFDGTSWVEI